LVADITEVLSLALAGIGIAYVVELVAFKVAVGEPSSFARQMIYPDAVSTATEIRPAWDVNA
jgi:hypothetical protein